MRILQICQRPQRRGAEVFAGQLSAELRRQGHEVAVVYLYPHAGKGVLPLGPEDRLLDGDEDHPLETVIGFRPALLRRLKDVIESFRPDVTQVNGARTVKYGVLGRRLKGAPAGPVVYRNIGAPDDWIRGVRRKVFYHTILRNVDGVVAISRGSLEALRPVFPEYMPLTAISNAVDPASLRPTVGRDELRTSTGTPASAPVAIFVGSLSSEKRVDRLIDAVPRVRSQGPDLHLWIVGEGPCRDELEARVERLALGGVVRFFGSRDDVASCIAAADLLALVSDTEGVPAVVLEAGCLGLPVVATRVGAVAECVEDGETGLLVERGDGDALAAGLTRLAGDAELRDRLGRRARERVMEHHSIERIAKRYLEFYQAVRKRPGPGRRRVVQASPDSVVPERSRTEFTPEMRLIVLLARADLEPATESQVREALGSGLDWDVLIALARRHRLSALVTTHLRRFCAEVPPDVHRTLMEEQFARGCRILERTGQLLEVLSALRDRGVVAVPYKGPALGAQLYGSGTLRHAGDLDILVRPRDVPKARAALMVLGYRCRTPIGEGRVRFMVKNRYDEEFLREDGSHVELHWGFTNREFPFALDLDGVFSRLDTVNLGGHPVPAFSPHDLLLILCVHGAKHRWDRLEWLAGVAQLLRASGGTLDWEALVERASALGVRRSLFLALWLSRDLLGAPVPPAVLGQVRGDPHLRTLAAQVVDLLGRDPAGWEVPDRLQRDRFRIQLRERWRDRARFVWYRSTIPSDPGRWDVARLGRWHVPLHAFRRPFHVAGELMSALRALIPSSA